MESSEGKVKKNGKLNWLLLNWLCASLTTPYPYSLLCTPLYERMVWRSIGEFRGLRRRGNQFFRSLVWEKEVGNVKHMGYCLSIDGMEWLTRCERKGTCESVVELSVELSDSHFLCFLMWDKNDFVYEWVRQTGLSGFGAQHSSGTNTSFTPHFSTLDQGKIYFFFLVVIPSTSVCM